METHRNGLMSDAYASMYENVGIGGNRRAHGAPVQQKVSGAEADRIKAEGPAAQKASREQRIKDAGEAAHKAATEKGMSPAEAQQRRKAAERKAMKEEIDRMDDIQLDELAPAVAALAGKAAGSLAAKGATAGAAKAGGGIAKAASSKLGQKAISAGSNMVGNKVTQKLSNEEVELNEEKKEGKKDACYHKVKSKYDVWPSAYASGALVKCRQKGAKNWGNSSKNESFNYNLEESTVSQEQNEAMLAVLIGEGIAYNEESAIHILNHMSDEWYDSLLEDFVLSEAEDPIKKQEAMNRAGRKGMDRQGQAKKGIDKLVADIQGKAKPKDPMAAIRAKRAAKKGKPVGQKPQKRDYDQEVINVKSEKPPEKPNAPAADTRKLKPGQKKDTLAMKAKKALGESELYTSFMDAYSEVHGLGKN